MKRQLHQRLSRAYLAPAVAGAIQPRWDLTPEKFKGFLGDVTFGDLGIAGRVSLPASFAEKSEEPAPALLCLPFADEEMAGIDPSTVRVFCADDSKQLSLVWDSGVNAEMGAVWSRVRCLGRYIPIGLPRDRLLRQLLRETARARRLAGNDFAHEAWAPARLVFRVLTEPPPDVVEELREFLTRVEVQTGPGFEQLKPYEIRFREGLHLAPFPLPKGHALESFRSWMSRVASKETKTFTSNLLEEELFYPPDPLPEVPWHRPGVQRPGNGIDWRQAERLRIWDYFDLSVVLPYLFPQDWWMYQHDLRHTGAASGYSGIRSTTVSRMVLDSRVAVEGPIVTQPVIVNGKIYVGSGKAGGYEGGKLFKIDLATGKVEGRFPTDGCPYFQLMQGIGGSPAVVGGRVYFTGIHGKVYCLDTATMTDKEPYTEALWVTDLKSPSQAQNQPINQLYGDSWSSPLVVNGKVYVGCGEGEDPYTYGFVFCLDAATGMVLWLFCTSKFTSLETGSDNKPNMIPASVAAPWAVAAGFRLHEDSGSATRETGCSVWSSCAYDRGLNRIYVGTGNSQFKESELGHGIDLPDEWYGSGLLSLDADTGEFCNFFQPSPLDSYRLDDQDVDVAGSPSIFLRDGERVVAFGSKNGSFFLLKPDTLEAIQKRQLLPRQGGSGLPDDPGLPLPDVDPHLSEMFENNSGVFATPAVHAGTGKLFVCLGRDSIEDPASTPFVRALDWMTLRDAWPTIEGADQVTRYANVKPPLYITSEAALSSPAVVNDVVFVSTNRTALYALDVQDGHCLWAALDLGGNYALGPAIYGDYVVMGADEHVYIYVLGPRWAHIRPDRFVAVPPASSPYEEPPWEGPDLRRLEREKWKTKTEEPMSAPKGLLGVRQLLLKMLSRLMA